MSAPTEVVPKLNPGEKPPLRIMLFQMGAMITSGSFGIPDGYAGQSFLDYSANFNEFNRSFVWNFDKTMFGNEENGTYTGVLGQIVANEGDAFILPLPMLPSAEGVIEVGPTLLSSPTVLVTVPQITKEVEKVLETLFRFSPEIVILLLLFICCFARLINSSEGMVRYSHGHSNQLNRFFEGEWKILEIMLLQINLSPVTRTGKSLLLTTLIGIMFWYTMWTNQMKADWSSVDTSKCVESLDDLLKTNLTVRLSATDPTYYLIESKAKYYPDSNVAELYRRALTYSHKDFFGKTKNTKPLSFDQEMVMGSAFMTSMLLVRIFQTLACLIFPDVEFLVASDTFFEGSTYSPWVNPRYPTPWKRMLFKKFVRIRETGLVLYTNERIAKDSMQPDQIKMFKEFMDPKKLSKQCIYHNVESYVNYGPFADENLFVALAWKHYDTVALLVGSLFLFAGFVLFIEKTRLIESAPKMYRTMKNKKIFSRFRRSKGRPDNVL